MNGSRAGFVLVLAAGCIWLTACGDVIKITPKKLPTKEVPVAVAEPAPAPEAPKKAEFKLVGAKLEGDQVKVDHIEFETDKAIIREKDPETKGALEAILNTLKDNPHITELHVEGHTDNTGTVERNKKLSQQRAEAVIAWLVKNGVDAKRLEAHGYGPDKPKDTNDTPAGRKENRRVEFHIGSVDGKEFKP